MKGLESMNLDDSLTEALAADEDAAEEAQRDGALQANEARMQASFSQVLRVKGRAMTDALMTIAGTRQRSGRLWLMFLATSIVIVLLLVQVYYRHRELNLGYALSAAIADREALLEDNRKLRIELRILSSRERLAPLAMRQLGMVTLKPEQILFVTKPRRDADTPTPRGTRRQDGLDNVKLIVED
ncbi:MAG: cell division protein FtsL [Proteobacteria bacterium]|nr:cell division protein FtsL [Pseudomonadota bacterium]